MIRLLGAAAAIVGLALMTRGEALAQSTAIQIDRGGNVGIGTETPSQKLDVKGDMHLSGTLIGNSRIGGNAALMQGYGTGGSAAGFSFKYDYKNFGHTPKAIQIWNASMGVYKTFIVDHPTASDRYIVHATLEGPEGAVFYRGTASLENGRAVVELPHYFEALTHEEGRTVLLTNIDGFDRLAVKRISGRKIIDGKFEVVSDNPASAQTFDWEVKAVRKDKPRLVVEPLKSEIGVAGIGPYTFAVPTR